MNDRFKFRWPLLEDKTNKFIKFVYSDCFVGKHFDPPKKHFGEPEQCTGLKDKNGKLIYEGDILFVKTLDWKNKVKWDAEEVRTYWSVEYKDYLNHRGFMVFGINRRFHKPLTKTVIFNSEAIIVGNIHENKELLDER